MDPQAQPFTPQVQPATPQAPPTHTNLAVVVRGVPTGRKIGNMWRWMEEDNKRIGLKILGARWLLQEARRVGKQASSLVLYLASGVKAGTRLRMGQKWFTTCAYDFDRGSCPTTTTPPSPTAGPSMSTTKSPPPPAPTKTTPTVAQPPPPPPPPVSHHKKQNRKTCEMCGEPGKFNRTATGEESVACTRCEDDPTCVDCGKCESELPCRVGLVEVLATGKHEFVCYDCWKGYQ